LTSSKASSTSSTSSSSSGGTAGQRKASEGVGSQNGTQSTAAQQLEEKLLVTFSDRLACMALAAAICVLVQYSVLLWWLLRVNKRYYAWAQMAATEHGDERRATAPDVTTSSINAALKIRRSARSSSRVMPSALNFAVEASPPPSPPASGPFPGTGGDDPADLVAAWGALRVQAAWRRKCGAREWARECAELREATLVLQAVTRLQSRVRTRHARSAVSAAMHEHRQDAAAAQMQRVWRHHTWRLANGRRHGQLLRYVIDERRRDADDERSGRSLEVIGSTVVEVMPPRQEAASTSVHGITRAPAVPAAEACTEVISAVPCWDMDFDEEVLRSGMEDGTQPAVVPVTDTDANATWAEAGVMSTCTSDALDANTTATATIDDAALAARAARKTRLRLRRVGSATQFSNAARTPSKRSVVFRRVHVAEAAAVKRMREWHKRRSVRKPKFHSVPVACLWPNPQVSVVIIFAGGLVEASTAVLGALASGVPISAPLATVSKVAPVLVAVFLLLQLRRLVHFHRAHMRTSWENSEPPADAKEIADPLLALLVRLRMLRPRPRERGGYVVPEQYAVEPQRTELALAEAFSCGLCFRERMARWFFHRRLGHYTKRLDTAGWHLERLNSWLTDGVATAAGLCFSMMQVVLQLALAINTGFFFAHPFALSIAGQIAQLCLNLALQIFAALFVMCGTANDLWNGAAVASVYLLEGVGTCFLVRAVWLRASVMPIELAAQSGGQVSFNASNVSALLMDGAWMGNTSNITAGVANGDDALARLLVTAQCVRLAAISATLLQVAIFVPLVLTMYDILVVPAVRLCWRTDAGTPLEFVSALVVAAITVPLQLAKNYLGIHANVADVFDEYGDAVAEVAGHAIEGDDGLLSEPAANDCGAGVRWNPFHVGAGVLLNNRGPAAHRAAHDRTDMPHDMPHDR